MSIFSRLSDIINSNINSMLDKAEDPEKIIRMIVQEMEDTLVEVRSSAARTIADQKDVERQLGRLEKAQTAWEAKAELAISKGREDLAKGALIEKAKLADAADHMAAELEHLKAALSSHEDDVIKLEAKLREARAKKKALAGRQTTVQNRLKVNRNLRDTRIDNAFERFDKVEQRIDRIESEIESYDLGDGATLEDAIAGLETDEAIEKELEALKARVSGSKTGGKAKDDGAKGDKSEAAE
jgi:phage shock protein A